MAFSEENKTRLSGVMRGDITCPIEGYYERGRERRRSRLGAKRVYPKIWFGVDPDYIKVDLEGSTLTLFWVDP